MEKNYLQALEREAFLRAVTAERTGTLTPDEREAVWSPWVSLRAAAYQERLRGFATTRLRPLRAF